MSSNPGTSSPSFSLSPPLWYRSQDPDFLLLSLPPQEWFTVVQTFHEKVFKVILGFRRTVTLIFGKLSKLDLLKTEYGLHSTTYSLLSKSTFVVPRTGVVFSSLSFLGKSSVLHFP